jgi:hypothetical protein
MNPLAQDFLATIFRKLLTSAAAALVTYGWITPEQSEAYVAGLVIFLVSLVWSLWQRYKDRLEFLTAIISPQDSTEAEVKAAAKTDIAPPVTKTLVVLLAAGMSMTTLSACGGGMKRAPVLVGQTTLATGQTIGQIQRAIKSLTRSDTNPKGVISPENALIAQEALLKLNTQLEPVPALLRAIDVAQQTGNVDQSQVLQAIDMLQKVSADLSIVVAGIPLSDATKQIMTLVQTGQTTVTTLLVQLGKIQAAFLTASNQDRMLMFEGRQVYPLLPYYADAFGGHRHKFGDLWVGDIYYDPLVFKGLVEQEAICTGCNAGRWVVAK